MHISREAVTDAIPNVFSKSSVQSSCTSGQRTEEEDTGSVLPKARGSLDARKKTRESDQPWPPAVVVVALEDRT